MVKHTQNNSSATAGIKKISEAMFELAFQYYIPVFVVYPSNSTAN